MKKLACLAKGFSGITFRWHCSDMFVGLRLSFTQRQRLLALPAFRFLGYSYVGCENTICMKILAFSLRFFWQHLPCELLFRSMHIDINLSRRNCELFNSSFPYFDRDLHWYVGIILSQLL